MIIRIMYDWFQHNMIRRLGAYVRPELVWPKSSIFLSHESAVNLLRSLVSAPRPDITRLDGGSLGRSERLGELWEPTVGSEAEGAVVIARCVAALHVVKPLRTLSQSVGHRGGCTHARITMMYADTLAQIRQRGDTQ